MRREVRDVPCPGAGTDRCRACVAARAGREVLPSTPAPGPSTAPRRRWRLLSRGAAAPDLAGRCHGW